MKKLVSAILLVIYFTLSSGVVINLHYCMNRFDSVKLGTAKTEICGRCGMHSQDASGCCHDEVKFVKLQNDQQASYALFNFDTPSVILTTPEFIISEGLISGQKASPVNNHSPPLNKQDTYLLNCVFRI